MDRQRTYLWYAAFATTIFLSALLLFQIQPLIGKTILPWFGGATGVWTTCMLFFQVVLFAGYAYAHGLIRFSNPRQQMWVHGGAILIALFFLPIAPAIGWRPSGAEDPIWRILGLLATSIGIPYFVLSANGPLLQSWFSRSQPGVSPYALYALSNVGSLLGLISYPFVVEPWIALDTQASFWSWGFAIFAVCCLVCAAAASMVRTPHALPEVVESQDTDRPAIRVEWLWFALPACASILLLATTNQVCIDVAAIPFLWVVPLALYLMTFILSFAGPAWYPRRAYRIAFVVAVVSLCAVLYAGAKADLELQLGVYFTALFVCCMVCHGELVLLKPHPSRLTLFYLLISAGGAAGGVFVGLAAPTLFSKYLELHIGIFLCSLLVLIANLIGRGGIAAPDLFRRRTLLGGLVGIVALAVYLPIVANKNWADQIVSERNFYGVLRIRQYVRSNSQVRILNNGQILHGAQFLDDGKRKIPTTYYGKTSGIGRVLSVAPRQSNVGVVGLGVGTLAVYARPGDQFTFYDINPAVIRLANDYFYYLKDCAVRPSIVLGDARLSLEREPPRDFDVLAVDAFSSDAIPMHLLTLEAFQVYLKHLGSRGILAIHISNRHFNLKPVVQGAADEFGLFSSVVHSAGDELLEKYPATWVLLARDPNAFAEVSLSESQAPQPPNRGEAKIVWTDNFSNLYRVLN